MYVCVRYMWYVMCKYRRHVPTTEPQNLTSSGHITNYPDKPPPGPKAVLYSPRTAITASSPSPSPSPSPSTHHNHHEPTPRTPSRQKVRFLFRPREQLHRRCPPTTIATHNRRSGHASDSGQHHEPPSNPHARPITVSVPVRRPQVLRPPPTITTLRPEGSIAGDASPKTTCDHREPH